MGSTLLNMNPLGSLPSPPAPRNEYLIIHEAQGGNEAVEEIDEAISLHSFTLEHSGVGAQESRSHYSGRLANLDVTNQYKIDVNAREKVRPPRSAPNTGTHTKQPRRRLWTAGPKTKHYETINTRSKSQAHNEINKSDLAKRKPGKEGLAPFEIRTADISCKNRHVLHRMARSAPSTPLGQRGITIDSTYGHNVRVVTRIRPLSLIEESQGSEECITVSKDLGQEVLKILFESSSGLKYTPEENQINLVQKEFPFDICIESHEDQNDVFLKCGIPDLLDEALDGTNVTVFAYGQTGSGKTYTMSGKDLTDIDPVAKPNDHNGIIPRSLSYIFEKIKQRMGDDGTITDWTIGASYYEIYNENVYDLLQWDAIALQVKWDPGQGFHIPELHIQPCNTVHDVRAVLGIGNRRRKSRSQAMNAESSRSHTVFTLYMASSSGQDLIRTPQNSKLVFVDLAGSERLKDSCADSSASIKETANINKSLFMLGKVISALASGLQGPLIPYRESKLTKLLIGSMGGPSKYLMIACCSSSYHNIEETLSTLTYASRAKNIQSIPSFHLNALDMTVAALKREIRMLRTENALLKEQLKM